jgi:pyruvate dehydrogenase E1 component beta subunit
MSSDRPTSATPRPAEATANVLTFGGAIREVMREALSRHPHVVILGQGVADHKGTFGSTLGMADEFGTARVIDTPLAEEGMTGIAIGAALNGLYPIQVHIRVDFLLLALNQIVNIAAKYRYMYGGVFEVPTLIRAVIGRSWGQGAQHSQSIQSMLAHVPGLVVLMPASAQSILDDYPRVVAGHRGPVVSLEHRLLYDLQFRVNKSQEPRDPVLGSRVARRGRDLTVVATSIMVLEALRAADHLEREAGIDCEVVDFHCPSHPDAALIVESVRRTGRLLVADTSWPGYGVCAEVCRLVVERAPESLRAPVVSVGLAPTPCPTAKALEDLFYPSLRTLTDAMAALATGRRDHGVSLPDERSMADVYRRFKGPF